MRAEKLQKRAARVGFDWPEADPVFDKIDEEIGEIKNELAGGGNTQKLGEECGDLLFSCVNLLRHLNVDPETALRNANRKFERRFRAVETSLTDQGRQASDAPLDELEALWQQAKDAE